MLDPAIRVIHDSAVGVDGLNTSGLLIGEPDAVIEDDDRNVSYLKVVSESYVVGLTAFWVIQSVDWAG